MAYPSVSEESGGELWKVEQQDVLAEFEVIEDIKPEIIDRIPYSATAYQFQEIYSVRI